MVQTALCEFTREELQLLIEAVGLKEVKDKRWTASALATLNEGIADIDLLEGCDKK